MQKATPTHYAQAIYALSKKDNKTDQLIADLESVLEEFKDSPSFYKHLSYPKMSLIQKKENLKQVFADYISETTYKILILLIKNKHLGWLDKIINKIQQCKKSQEDILEANVYVPQNLDEDQTAKIKSILNRKTGKQVLIDEIIDKKIIGGIKINMGGLVIDGSILNKINKLKNSIKNI